MGGPLRRPDPLDQGPALIFVPTKLDGVWLLELERRADPRGHFARTFCAEEFVAHGLPTAFPQCNLSFNAHRATLRGLHWQDDPHPEGKLVRCTRGAIFDVAVDIRPASPTRHQAVAYELSAENGRSLYIPPGFAHGFQTLADDTEVFYQMTETYHADLARGLRWDDPAFAIQWPLPNPLLSERDASHPVTTA